MVWDRSDEKERVSNPGLIRLAIDFHHVEVARWLLQEQPLWLDIGRLFARETRAFDILSRLPRGSAELPTLDDVSRVERKPRFDGAVSDAVETKATSWLAAALLAGGNPNQRITNWLGEWDTVLGHAASSGYEGGVQLLLQFGADPNQEGDDGKNALAGGARYPGIVELLLERGANPNAGFVGTGLSPMVWAAVFKKVESLRLMLAHGGDASLVRCDGRNVLHSVLMMFPDAECCRELISHGADPCGQGGYSKETPMHIVAKHDLDIDGPERVKVLDLLLDAGASLQAKDWMGLTPGEVARQSGRASQEVLEWFSRHEAA
jgi:ankyrin repeat protein